MNLSASKAIKRDLHSLQRIFSLPDVYTGLEVKANLKTHSAIDTLKTDGHLAVNLFTEDKTLFIYISAIINSADWETQIFILVNIF